MKKKILFLLSLVMLTLLTVPSFAEEPDHTSGTPGPNIDLEGDMTEEMAADVKDSSSLDIKQAKIDFYFFDIENKETHSMSTAYGSCFQISGPMQMSFLKNGSFYSNDQGAEPDFQLIKPSSFYDHQALAEFINTLR